MLDAEVPSNDIRFQIELEFVQCLASPAYLNCRLSKSAMLLVWLLYSTSVDLATNRYFENPAFMNYIKYLEYWKKPEYAQYIVYPHCLAFLDLIQTERFRQMIARDDFMTLVHSQQFYHWRTFLNNRMTEDTLLSKVNENSVN
uniref:Mediator of RNA polymerase II transcription subunit 31 n=1 Tax=Albugo laibachii Nc14 TaxID=890382 RepID=F0WII8_9STRA|nr:mediator of RNA polymerase II transcription subunit 31 putative [Albugo laibachii Nc14]|eukprot:CCA21070.1 mediator of RNA polymerase II transcription subunit 31 putative [Albugo laibachii Nc14]